MMNFIQKCVLHILTVLLANVIFVIGQDSFGFKCTYQIIGPDNMVLSAFDDGYRGSWLGKVTAEPYQEDIRQHWQTINYLGTNLTTLTPEDNPDNHIALNMRRWCPVWKTEFPLQNTYKIIEENDNMFVLKKILFQLNRSEADEEDEINFGCVQYMGQYQRVKMMDCTDNPNQRWRFNLIRASSGENNEEASSRNKCCSLKQTLPDSCNNRK